MMRYGDYLRRLLQPLGVYALSEGSISGAALDALGAALDDAAAELTENQRESLIATAQDAGLSQMERLAPYLATGSDAQARRDALAGFLRIGGDGFTRDALNRCLAACGTTCVVYETGERGAVSVRFPHTVGEPSAYAEKQRIIESILPCHLETRYEILWCTFAMTAAQQLTWGDLAPGTFRDWAMRVPAEITAAWQ